MGNRAQKDGLLTLEIEEFPELSTASSRPPPGCGGVAQDGAGSFLSLRAARSPWAAHSHGVLDPRGWCTGDQRWGEGPELAGPWKWVTLTSPLSPGKGAWSLEVPAWEGGRRASGAVSSRSWPFPRLVTGIRGKGRCQPRTWRLVAFRFHELPQQVRPWRESPCEERVSAAPGPSHSSLWFSDS